MDVVSLAPVPVSSLHWRTGEGPWSIAVVCKLTFELRPDRARLAKRQVPIHSEDLRPAGFPADRILAPCDCVPARAAVDVTAFAPQANSNGESSEVRIAVGTIDKRVTVVGAFALDLVGYAVGSRERPLAAPLGTDDVVLREGFDWSAFNSAPPDQRLHELGPDAEFHLTGMHPDHRHLTTRLPNVQPQAFIERDGARRELPMRIDGVWFDGTIGICCVTFRAQAGLAQRHESCKLFVAVAGPDRRLSDTGLGELIDQLRGSPTDAKAHAVNSVFTGQEGEDTLRTQRHREATATSLLGGLIGDCVDDATGDNFEAFEDLAPLWLKRDAFSGPPAVSSARGTLPSLPASAPYSSKPHLHAGETQAVPALTESSPLLATPTILGLAPAPLLTTPAALGAPLPRPSLPHPSATAMAPALTDSPWSRGKNDPEPAPPTASRYEAPEPEREAPRVVELPKRPSRDVVELLWFDAEETPKLRRRFSTIAEALEFEPRDPQHDLASPDPSRARDHHTHFGLLTELLPIGISELRERVRESVSDSGKFTPPLVALTGELSLPFDALEHLRATAAVMTPLLGDDRKLGEALGSVDELIASPLAAASFEPVQKMHEHLRRTYRETRRTVSLEQLDEIVTRSLLEQRKYQRRTLLGGRWIRALLTTSGSREAVPCYLPDALASDLPMMTAFRARVLAETHVRLDQYETARFALRAVTLGRVLEF